MNLVTVEDFLISSSQLRRFVVPVLSFFLFLNSGFSLTFFNVVRKHEKFVCIVELQHKYFFLFISLLSWFFFGFPRWNIFHFCRKCMFQAFYPACPICSLFIRRFSGLKCFISYCLCIYFSQQLSFSRLLLMLFCRRICCMRI